MSPARPPAAATVSEALLRTLESAGASAQGALGRLYAPATVRLGPMTVDEAPLRQLLPAGTRAVGVGLEVLGAVRAQLWLLATEEAAAELAEALLPPRPETPTGQLDADARAALAEVANIVASSFLNGLARATKSRLLPSVPRLAEEPAEPLRARLHASGQAVVAATLEVAHDALVTRAAVVIAVEPGALEELLAGA